MSEADGLQDLLLGDELAEIDLLPANEDDDDFVAFLDSLDPGPFVPQPSFGSGGDGIRRSSDIASSRAPALQPTAVLDETFTINAAEVSRQEKIRAKNRRGQAKYREKLKREKQALDARISDVKRKLAHSNARYRDLRNGRAESITRIDAAAAQLTGYAESCAQNSAGAHHSTTIRSPHSEAPAVHHPAWPQQDHPKPSGPSPVIPLFAGAAGIFTDLEAGSARDISSFSHFAGVTQQDVFAHLPLANDPLGSKSVPVYLPQAIRDHEAAVTAISETPRDDICWFVQLPFSTITGIPLSHSACIGSMQCKLSLMLFGEALALESAFLVKQHELLLEESPDTTPSQDSSGPANDAAVMSPAADACAECMAPRRPSAAVCGQSLLRCGVNDTCTITEGVEGALVPILRKYRRTLRQDLWRSVCIKDLSNVLSNLQQMTPPETPAACSECSAAHSNSSSTAAPASSESTGSGNTQVSYSATAAWCVDVTGDAQFNKDAGVGRQDGSDCADTGADTQAEGSDAEADFATAVLGILGSVAQCLWREVQDAACHPKADEVGIPFSRQETEARMLEVNMAPAISCVLLFQQAPYSIRKMCQSANSSDAELSTVDNQQLRLMRSLALQPDQRAHCAQIWRQWYKKRRALDRAFDAAIDRIEASLPGISDVPAALVKRLDHLTQEVATSNMASTGCAESGCTPANAAACGHFDTSAPENTQLQVVSEKMLGATGFATEGSADMLRELRDVHTTDGLLYEHVVSLTAMPSWFLTPLQHSMLHAATLEEGVNLVDNLRLCQVAAQEERWKEVFDSMRL